MCGRYYIESEDSTLELLSIPHQIEHRDRTN